MNKGLCKVADCSSLARTAGWCNKHYLRWWKYGDPLRGRLTPVERFWSKVDKSQGDAGCWTWTGRPDRRGYGRLLVGGKNGQTWFAHRFSYEQEVGPIPAGHHVLHHCDNPPCVNPAHLFTGTDADNIMDMDIKGRRLTKMTADTVRAIRTRYASGGVPQHVIAAEFGIGQAQVSKIVRRESWVHIE